MVACLRISEIVDFCNLLYFVPRERLQYPHITEKNRRSLNQEYSSVESSRRHASPTEE